VAVEIVNLLGQLVQRGALFQGLKAGDAQLLAGIGKGITPRREGGILACSLALGDIDKATLGILGDAIGVHAARGGVCLSSEHVTFGSNSHLYYTDIFIL